MEIFLVSLAAFAFAILTFFSGFGLGTLLTPVFMLFFPAPLAVALTGVVHFFNNIFKLILVGKMASREVVLKFGIPAVIAAFIGSNVLLAIDNNKTLLSYTLQGLEFRVFPVKFMVAVLLIIFASIDLIPRFQRLAFSKNKLPLGGALSGFFGGLSGNQGALRSAFLIKAGLSKEAFIGTTVVVSTMVDITRLGVYAIQFSGSGLSQHRLLVLFATLAGIAGSFVGNKLLAKVTIQSIRTFVAVLLLLVSAAMAAGWL